MVISDTSSMIDGLPLLYWRRDLGKSGQSWDYKNRRIARLHNCAVADLTPQLWHDVTPQQSLKCKEIRDGWWN